MTLSPSGPVICISSAPSRPAPPCPPKLQRRRVLAPARRSFSAGGLLRNLFVPMHLETKLHPRKNPPLSKPFRISILQNNKRLRPYPPLSKSFVFNTVRKTLQKAPLSKPFRFNRLQTSCKAPLSKSFRITWFQKQGVFFQCLPAVFKFPRRGN